MPEWLLIIAMVTSGTFTGADAKVVPLPMQSLDACSNAAKKMAENSAGNIAFLCVSTSTGDVVRFEAKKAR